MRKHDHAITLIELVATVSAIALLAAMLAPALADVSRRGKDTVCLQNLARIAQASIVYASEDENEQAIPVHPQIMDPFTAEELRRAIGAYCWGGKSGRGRESSDDWAWGTVRHKGPATRPLNRILYGEVFPEYYSDPGPDFINWTRDTELDLPVYRCPSDNGYTGIHYASWEDSRLTSYDHYGNSYAASLLWIYVPGVGICMSNSPFLHRLSDIVNPLQTVYYMENCGRYAWLADPVDPGCDVGRPEVVKGWHGQPWLFNAAFVDGHVEPTHMRGYRNPHLGHYPEQGGWDDPYFYWRCVIIRGDNWQLDTLPLRPVLTSIPCSGCRDGDVDLDDFAAFQIAFTQGP